MVTKPLADGQQARRSERHQTQHAKEQHQQEEQPSLLAARAQFFEPARLTRRNLDVFNHDTTSRWATASHNTSSSSGSVSTKLSGFATQAAGNGILSQHASRPPRNITALRRRYAARRATESPTESVFNDYTEKTACAPNEATLTAEFQHALMKNYKKGYQQSLGQAFTGFPRRVGFNNGIGAARPDYVQGLHKAQFQPVDVDEIRGAVLYADNPGSITLPHLAGEFKKLGGNLTVAEMAASYDGAALSYGRKQALASMDDGTVGDYADAHVATFTTDGRFLDTYAHYADEQGRYHQYRIASADLATHEGFRNGYRMIRNAQDHALEESCKLRDRIRGYYHGAGGRRGDKNNNADEDAEELGDEDVKKIMRDAAGILLLTVVSGQNFVFFMFLVGVDVWIRIVTRRVRNWWNFHVMGRGGWGGGRDGW